ncbi:MAG: substrate-binding domain-containing protein [Oscillospiraceae bacterium]|nr:substrate-binding domain-containing protein [Oscillospiraceae bacterium]
MNLKKYYLATTLMALIISPLVISFAAFMGVLLSLPAVFSIIITIPLLIPMWSIFAAKVKLPEKTSQLLFPFLIMFCYYMGVWIVLFGLSGYRFYREPFEGVFHIMTIPFLFVNFFYSFSGEGYGYFPVIVSATTAITMITVLITRKRKKNDLVFDGKTIVYGALFAILICAAVFQHFERNAKVLSKEDYNVERIRDEVDLYNYQPFREQRNAQDEFYESDSEKARYAASVAYETENLLKTLDEQPTVTFEGDYPRLDGATAAYPVYAAMTQALYKGLDERTVNNYVKCSTTDEAYERLIRGEIDVFFGAQPSQQQIASANENGLQFELTPIAKEAFVFFVNKENPVDSLTPEQIQDIYQKKTTNWKKVGGKNERIMPFQRPENSGSQTIMLAAVMKDKTLPPPLWEESADLMGGMISRVAEYRNYASAIGYSFRYFATGMKPNQNIKLLSVDGIAPTVENIQNSTYPFTVEVYAVTTNEAEQDKKSENIKKLLDWILSEQGQSFIEKCGYIRI